METVLTISKLYFELGCLVTVAIALSEALAPRRACTRRTEEPDKGKGSFLGMVLSWLLVILLWPVSLTFWIKASLREMTLYDLFNEWKEQNQNQTARFRWVDATPCAPRQQTLLILIQKTGGARTHAVARTKNETLFWAARLTPEGDGRTAPLGVFPDLETAKMACENDVHWILLCRPEATQALPIPNPHGGER